MKYNPAIDGLRAISFLIVFLFHCNIPGFQVGWSGVNIFFVLSGFLITSILLEAKHSNNYFTGFYMRRILRIFPIYYAVLFAMFAFWVLSGGGEWHRMLYYLTYTQNIFHAFGADDPIRGPIFHTWTLAIEEQFYLFWPFIVYYMSRKNLLRLSVVLIIISPLLRILFYRMSGSVFMGNMLLFCQTDSLAFGAILALVPFQQQIKPSRLRNVLFLSGLVLFLGLTVYLGILHGGKNPADILMTGYNAYNTPDGYLNTFWGPFIFSVVGLMASALVVACYDPESRLAKVLSNNVLVHVGKISYGLYLYHWIIIIFLRFLTKKYPLGNAAFFFLSLGLTYIAAVISYYTFERYFMNKKKHFAYLK